MSMKQIVHSAALTCSIGLGLVTVQACADKSSKNSIQAESTTNEIENTARIQQDENQKIAEQTAKEAADKLAAEQALAEKAVKEVAVKEAAIQRAAAEKAAELAITKAAEKERAATNLADEKAAKLVAAKAKKDAEAKIVAESAAKKIATKKLAEEQAAETARLAAIEAAKNKAAITPPPAPILAAAQNTVGNPEAGALVFKKCRACHSNVEGKKKVGPSLFGVVGRTPGTLEGYKYSTAMKNFGAGGAVWDAQTLSEYLTSPRTMLPKVKMIFPGLKEQQDRLDIISYLDTLNVN